MALNSRSLKLDLLIGLRGNGIDEAVKDLKRFGRQVNSLSNTVVSAAAGFAAFAASRKLVEFGGAAIDEARDLTRNVAGLSSVFESTTPQLLEFSRNAADMGLSMNEAAKASTFIGSVLKQSGFSIEETADLTERLVSLGTDLAITYGYDVQEALLGMTALFRGEYDPIEKFGVAMKQSEINAELAARELDGLEGASRRLAEQQIRVEFLFQRAADSLGNYSKQAGTLFAAQQTLRATFENVQAAVGYGLTPAMAELALALRPLVESLIPVLQAVFNAIIPVVKDLVSNKERLRDIILGVARVFYTVVKAVAALTSFIINNAESVMFLVSTLGTLLVGVKVWQVMAAGIMLANSALLTLNVSIVKTAKALRTLKLAIAATGFGLIVAAIGLVGSAVMAASDDIDDSVADLDAQLKAFDSAAFESDVAAATEGLNALNSEMAETAGGAGAASDALADFYNSMADDARKLSARLQLETLGASKGLIEKILGSGEDWYRVFQSVVAQGAASVRNVQAMFLQTAAGFDEAMEKWQQEYDAFKEFEKQALEAKDALVEFINEFKILPSIAEEIGEFERSAVNQLASIEEKLKDAFDNKYLLEESYNNLLQYARDEFNALRQIERQRDQLLARRNAAAEMIKQVQTSIAGTGNIVSLMRDLQDSAEQIDVVEFAQKAVSAGGELREFRTALITNFVEPIVSASSKADKLVQSYRSVVERTREFVENLKALRALGLDPMLFNQLIEAGVEAGGETAQALVDGGAKTINEINSLFAELDALGAELGENTAQVMYGQGELFVNGIVAGLESQLDELETMANSLAEAFTTTFEDVLIAGIERAIAAAEAALSRMPQAPNMDFDFTPRPGTDGPGTLTPTQQALQNLPRPLAPTLGNLMFTRPSIAVPTTPTSISSFSRPQPISPLGGRQYATINQTTYITTGTSTAQTKNAVVKANSTTGKGFALQTPNSKSARVN